MIKKYVCPICEQLVFDAYLNGELVMCCKIPIKEVK